MSGVTAGKLKSLISSGETINQSVPCNELLKQEGPTVMLQAP